jgi:hypothetical protein
MESVSRIEEPTSAQIVSESASPIDYLRNQVIPRLSGLQDGGRKRSETSVLYLPTPCPECQELTMEVVDIGPNDEYQAKCTVCGTRSSGTLKVEIMISNGGIESAAEGA